LPSNAERQAEDTAVLPDLKSELAGILGYYQGLIAATAKLPSRLDAAGLVRRLQTELSFALRHAVDRHRAAIDNRLNALKPHPMPSKLPYPEHELR
jgi:hypothetical protein